MMLALLVALTTLFVGFGTLSQNPTSGGYQLFERAASGISADIQLVSLEKFCAVAGNRVGVRYCREYYIVIKDERTVAGIFTMVEPDFEGMSDHWFTFIAVADLAEAIQKGEEAGGGVMRPPFEVPGFGTLAVVKDATGAVFGMSQR